MHKAILLSHNAPAQACSIELAHQLLGCGIGRIVKFYPFTVAFKGNQEGPEVDMCPIVAPCTPDDYSKRTGIKLS